jgi:hypothetical protein
MKSDNDPVVPVAAPHRSPKPNARRLLLRGSFAAPTVLTLSSGSALANTSSLRCFTNLPTYVAGSQPLPNFFQVQRWVHNQVGLVDAHQITFIAKAQGFDAGIFTVDSTVAKETVWFRVSDASRYTVPDPVAPPTKDGSSSVALRFKLVSETPPSLQITGLSDGAGHMSNPNMPDKVLSSSCWSSFTPRRVQA